MKTRLRSILPLGVVWLLLLFLFLPVLVVVPVSLTSNDYLSLPTEGMTTRHYAALLDPERGWTSAIENSLMMGVVAAALATLVATAFSVGAWLRVGWWPSAVRIVMLSPLILPPVIYAVGMVRVLSMLRAHDSFVGVLMVHVVLSMPMAFLAVSASLSNLDDRMVLAARSLGARPMTIVTSVILPNIVPGMAAGAFLAFITSWDEITVTLFITSRRFVTLPRRIYTSIADSIDPALAAIATVLLATTVAVLVTHSVLAARRNRAVG